MASRQGRRLYSLWKADSRCYICKRHTIMPKALAAKYGIPAERLGHFLKNGRMDCMATIDHEINRFDPRRTIDEGRPRTWLCCYRCNNDRAKKDYEELPIEVRRDRSTNGVIAKLVSGRAKRKIKLIKIRDVMSIIQTFDVTSYDHFIAARDSVLDLINDLNRFLTQEYA